MQNQDTQPTVSARPKILLENERVKVFERHIKAGMKTRMHSHPDLVLYALKNSRTRYTYPDGKEEIVDLKAGDVVFKKAESHIAELIIPEESLDLMIELK